MHGLPFNNDTNNNTSNMNNWENYGTSTTSKYTNMQRKILLDKDTPSEKMQALFEGYNGT